VVVTFGLTAVCGAKPPGLRVILDSGARASDGLAMGSIDGLVAASPRDLAFVSSSAAVFLHRNGVTAAAVRAGDPAPPAVGGTVAEICCAAMNDQGTWAFATTLNGGVTRSAIVLHRQGSPPSVLPLDGGVAALALNAHGHVAYRAGQALYLWAGTGEPLRVASRSDPALDVIGRARLGRLLVSAAGTVVFAAADRRSLQRGIFRWTAATGVTPVVVTGQLSPLPGFFWDVYTDSFDVNGAGDVAFVTTIAPFAGGMLLHGVFRSAGGSSSSAVVARPGDFVAGESMVEIDPEYVGIDDAGGVTFEALLPSGRTLVRSVAGLATVLTPIDAAAKRFAPTPDSGGRVAWLRGNAIEGYDGAGTRSVLALEGDATQGPGSTNDGVTISAGGDAAWVTSRTALHRVRDGVPAIVRYAGDDTFTYAFRQGELLVLSTAPTPAIPTQTAPEEHLSIFLGDHLVPLVRSGTGVPGGTMTFAPGMLDSLVWRGSEAIFEVLIHTPPTAIRALARYRQALGILDILVREGDAAPGGMRITSATPLPVLGGPPVFKATFDAGGGGILAVESGRLRSVLATGEARPRRRAVKSIAGVAVDGDQLFAVATVGPGGKPDQRVLNWTGLRAARPRTLAANGRPAPGGGRLAAFDRLFTGGGRVVVEAYVEREAPGGDAELFTAYFLPRRGRLARLLARGDPVIGGTALESVVDLAVGRRDVVGLGTQIGVDWLERSILFQANGRALTALAVEGQETPVGGTFPALEVVLTDTSAIILARPDGAPAASWALLAPALD
jgi:hypothetical protein